MRALVTGANGLIGANVTRALLATGYEVRALVRATSDVTHIEDLRCEIVTGDVLAEETLREATRGCDLVFHTAVPFAYRGQVADDVRHTAIDGSRNVLVAAKATGVGRVVITSSSVVLGYRRSPEAIGESAGLTEWRNEPGYAVAKIEQDLAALELGRELGIEVVLPCPTLSIGPYGSRLSASNAIIVQYLSDPFRMTFPGGINVVAVQDVAAGHVILGEYGRPFERYILGGENVTWRQAHEVIAELGGVPPPQAVIGHAAAYLAASAEEMRATIEGRSPLTTREQAKMVGRFYWYESSRASSLGYVARSTRDVLAGAIDWLAVSPHISREVRTTMHLHPDVHAARRERRAAEASLQSAAP